MVGEVDAERGEDADSSARSPDRPLEAAGVVATDTIAASER